jgi:hypothetical protein
MRRALAAGEPASVVTIHLVGGYNALFTSADALVGTFGISAGNYTAIGSGVAIDNTYATSMSKFTTDHMAVIGVNHGISSHSAARSALWTQNAANAGLALASAMGGTASIKAAVVGGTLISEAPQSAFGGVSYQSINDMQATINALGGGAPDPRMPDRTIALAGVQGAQKMSANATAGSPGSLATLTDGYTAAVATLAQPVQKIDLPTLQSAYKVTGTAVSSFAAKLAAAELMVRSGANVVSLFDSGWDTHGDTTGTVVRNKMTSYVLAPLNTFMSRVVADPTRNVVVAIFGDFARSLPGSDHAPDLSVTVVGKYVKQGTTGRVDANVHLPAGSPGVAGLWAYLAAAAHAPSAPFGANPHGLVA